MSILLATGYSDLAPGDTYICPGLRSLICRAILRPQLRALTHLTGMATGLSPYTIDQVPPSQRLQSKVIICSVPLSEMK